MGRSKRLSRLGSAVLIFSAVLGWAAPTAAATIDLVAPGFSAQKPVPHLHIQGPIAPGDRARLAEAIARHVDCDPATLPDTGGNCAVVTLAGDGGDSVEAAEIARAFREGAIATWVVTGDTCLSACAVAFLGGSGRSAWPATGPYVDRTIEPGATLGFGAGAPPLDDWNLEVTLAAEIRALGPGESHVVAQAEDLFRLRAALPALPGGAWHDDPVEALRHACMRLLAEYEGGRPSEMHDRIAPEITLDIGMDDRGRRLTGFAVEPGPATGGIVHCATPRSDAGLGAAADISLHRGMTEAGILPAELVFFHRAAGWSEIAGEGAAAARVFQRGAIGHLFLPPDAPLDGELAERWLALRDEVMSGGAPPP